MLSGFFFFVTLGTSAVLFQEVPCRSSAGNVAGNERGALLRTETHGQPDEMLFYHLL